MALYQGGSKGGRGVSIMSLTNNNCQNGIAHTRFMHMLCGWCVNGRGKKKGFHVMKGTLLSKSRSAPASTNPSKHILTK
jgi:hypothetical protein